MLGGGNYFSCRAYTVVHAVALYVRKRTGRNVPRLHVEEVVVCADAATMAAEEASRHRPGWAGHSTTFTCVATGRPVPDVSWLRNDAETIFSDKIYTITTTTVGDRATSQLEVREAFSCCFHIINVLPF